MKKYIKPTVDIVDLKVKENLAALPTGLEPVVDETFRHNNQTMTLTTYNLASLITSQAVE